MTRKKIVNHQSHTGREANTRARTISPEASLQPNSQTTAIPLNAYESIIGTTIIVFLIWLLFNNF